MTSFAWIIFYWPNEISSTYEPSTFELIRHNVTFPLYTEVDEIYNFDYPASPIHYSTTLCKH
jgi:hypothetical protein